ncbi:hypothetical protein DV736_g2983, partial [Chaetothyriales sp. CBS 134916]
MEDQQPKQQKNSAEASTKISSKSFVPPKGFSSLVLRASDLVAESTEMFSALDAKQVWHICAPASVDVASIKELDLEAALRGDAILSDNGVSYSMQETLSDNSSLMLLRGTSGIYQPSTAKVARSFRLAVKAGSGTKASSAQDEPTFVAQSTGQKKAARQQPEGLGMRYQPFGSETKARPTVGTSSAQPSPVRKKAINSMEETGSQSKKLKIAKEVKLLEKSLAETDPEIAAIMKKEVTRQRESIVLIASENFTSRAVFDALGSPMSNKYSEGYPGARYYGGNQHIDAIELTCQKRALEAFHLDPEKWGVNVQCLSGSPANLQVYQALMRPHDRLMGLDLPHGGHLSHGYQTPQKKISAVSTYFETFPYRVNLESGIIDYDRLEENALMYRPKVLVAGTSAYCRLIDYERMRKIADLVGAYLVVDMAHISGLIAAEVIPSPFQWADVVTTTTHKSLRGPRGAMIFFRKGVRSTDAKTGKQVLYDLEGPINFSVFPGHQGGPHNHTITALAVALKQANTPEFKAYQEQVIKNAKTLEKEFKKLGHKLVSDGTDSHMVLLDLRSKSLDGARVEAVLEQINIACNKNSIPGDKSALTPGGIRIGAPAMTSRGFSEADFAKVAQYIDTAITLTKKIQSELPKEANKLKDFKAKVASEEVPEILQLRKEIAELASSFPLPV